ncbi:MAG TPA: DUF4188 domain-containing protein [Thermoanaerobaculia bacterium]|jgi:hypothetical protein
MAEILRQRLTAEIEGDFCVFIIGMRVNRLWKLHKWLPVAMAMGPMLKELFANPQLGFLGAQTPFSWPPVLIQYWRSFDALESYAKSREHTHLPAWAAFNRRVGQSGEVGIWHETYLVRAGEYETIYNNMPPYGLAKASRAVPATGAREGARGRIAGRA